MAKCNIGDTVFCSSIHLDKNAEVDQAIVEGYVLSLNRKSASVEFRNGIGIKTVGTVKLHKNVSFLLIEFGDFVNESANLDPLAKSILAYLRLLISDGSLIKFIKIRSEQELGYVLKHYGTYSHIILVGHGSKKGELLVGNDARISSQAFSALISAHCASGPTFLSMCCHSGDAAFAKKMSASGCKAFVGPLGTIHSCSASQFVQSFLGHHLLDGLRPKSAFDRARDNTPGSTCLRIWRSGKIC